MSQQGKRKTKRLLDFYTGPRLKEVPHRGESKSAAPHRQRRNYRFEPGGANFAEGGPLAIVWACNN